ncbi:MAG: Hsp20/alpha crystallin family protein, partial [Alphaproteobacteria bacterium]|nr:Hsp20/alpha crystallin family protein [Alphaproteobacteria bacterium]
MADIMRTQQRSVVHPLSGLRDEIDRMFDSFVSSPVGRLLPGMGGEMMPRVDVKETDKAFVISAELPGMKESDVDVSLSEGVLSISGEKKEEREEGKEGSFHVSERYWGQFRRSFRIPETVDENAIEASFAEGVLTLTLPKTQRKEPKKIQVGRKEGQEPGQT